MAVEESFFTLKHNCKGRKADEILCPVCKEKGCNIEVAVCMYICMCFCVYVYVYMCVCVCMYVVHVIIIQAGKSGSRNV